MTGSILRLGIFQFDPTPRDPASNWERIRVAGTGDLDLLITPELALTGYDLAEAATELATPIAIGESPAFFAAGSEPWSGPAILCGLVERGRRGIPYNTAVLWQGNVLFSHRKIYLPTYGMFDEARYFGKGRHLNAMDFRKWRLGILICEDFWHPGLAYVLAGAGIDLLCVLAAAPGRRVWEGDESGGRFASATAWERIARTTAQLYGIYVALANRIGVEGGVTFAGGSLLAGPGGDILARAGIDDETILVHSLSVAELERARRPYAHARDDDPWLVQREIERLRGARN